MKHTSTASKPSIPFHTLVKRVDAEDIVNDKIRTHDLTLEKKFYYKTITITKLRYPTILTTYVYTAQRS